MKRTLSDLVSQLEGALLMARDRLEYYESIEVEFSGEHANVKAALNEIELALKAVKEQGNV
jgi:hypothetical protein